MLSHLLRKKSARLVCQVSRMGMRSFATNKETFVHGNSGAYLDELYTQWTRDPQSVDASWATFFSSELGKLSQHQASERVEGVSDASVSRASILDHMKVQLLVRAYQVRGHVRANLDPLGILKPAEAPELDPAYYGLTERHLDETFLLGNGMLPNFRRDGAETMTLREMVHALQTTYCGTIGIEYTHIPERDRCDWVRARIEVPTKYAYSKEEKMRILDRLVWSDTFERFVHGKFPGEKRFGLEGCEALIPGMKALIDRAVDHHGVEHVVMGMPHRGRLNVLSNVVRKPAESIFCEFHGQVDTSVEGSGDVKYHLGMNYERPSPNGRMVHLSLVANPSHLEAVNPVVQGKTKAIQYYLGDKSGDKALGVLLHGDAAFAGQGVVYESLGLVDLPSYTTGGTIHIVVNNQIGFTTDPRFARSTPYCTAIAKAMNAPILHVNADDVEAVVFACQFAADYRHTYKKDVVIDMIGYRRHGHNEFDEPSFTQPRMYTAIKEKQRVLQVYMDKLFKEGVLTQAESDALLSRVWNHLEAAYATAKTYKTTSKEWLTSSWPGFKSPKELASEVSPPYPTGVPADTLAAIGDALVAVPAQFSLHKGLAKILEAKRKALESGQGIDMPTAEALAFGSLLLEGNHVRLSGQDVERGTFSHRHAVLHDQVNEQQYIPLAHLDASQAGFTVCNSSLSEYGILGFELGYSLVNPRSLVLWEAQFGDFNNGAQIIIDQFLVSQERKWLQRSGLTLLLPHGFDGQGPEHSSGRPERFLQMCDDDPNVIPTAPSRQIQDCNIQVCMVSTPANYFHALRRQVHRDFRKPLVLFNSKALLRHPLARSSMADMTTGTIFQRVIPEIDPIAPEKVKRVVFCSGQVYYALYKARELNNIDDLVLIRLEQISPFPYDVVMEELSRYKNATELTYVQEEPLNMGMWTYVQPRFNTALRALSLPMKQVSVVARPPSCAVATGLKKKHIDEELSILSRALYGKVHKVKTMSNGVPIFKH